MFADELKVARTRAGLTQGELADRITEVSGEPLTRQAVSRWEAGATPERDRWPAIEKALQVPSGWVAAQLAQTVTVTGSPAAVTVTANHSKGVCVGQPENRREVRMSEDEWFLWQIYRRIPSEKRREVLEACQLRLMRMVGQLVAE